MNKMNIYSLLLILFLLLCELFLQGSMLSLMDGLIVYLPFDGTPNDLSGNNNHAVPRYNVQLTTDRDGRPQKAVLFKGGCMEIAPSPSTAHIPNDFSFAVWIWPNSSNERSPSATIIDKGTAQTGCIGGWSVKQVDRRENNFWFFACSNEGYSDSYIGTHYVETRSNTWNHIVITKHNQILKFYLNGVLVRIGTSDITALGSNSNYPILIGATNGHYSNPASGQDFYYYGAMDELYIFNRTISPTEVTELFYFNRSTSFPSGQPSSQPTMNFPFLLRQGQVGYYPFNANARDESGNRNHGNVYGVISANDRFGIANSSYYFDGVSSYIEIPGLKFTFQNLTLSFWILNAGNSPNVFIFDYVTSASSTGHRNGAWAFFQDKFNPTDSDSFAFFYTNSTSIVYSKISIYFPQNIWVHIAFTLESRLFKVFYNGIFYGQTLLVSDFPVGDRYPFVIGGSNYRSSAPATVSNFFHGFLDDILVYNRALNYEEVVSLYNFAAPTSQPSSQPSRQPFSRPSSQPTTQPTSIPTKQPAAFPSAQPSTLPTSAPTNQPTSRPSSQPSSQPSAIPTHIPASNPSSQPSTQPSVQPSTLPSVVPSIRPSTLPSCTPSNCPSSDPTITPSTQPSAQPVGSPSALPSSVPASIPSLVPTRQPTSQPTSEPTRFPSSDPTYVPSTRPASCPSVRPSNFPSSQPSSLPSSFPSNCPSTFPTTVPTTVPSERPSAKPTNHPSTSPSVQPTGYPSQRPFSFPSLPPSSIPTCCPSTQPSYSPTSCPSDQPTGQPTRQPSSIPSSTPTLTPSKSSSTPTFLPTPLPSTRTPTFSFRPTLSPTTSPTFFKSNTTLTISTTDFTSNLFFLGSYQPSGPFQTREEILFDGNPISSTNFIIFGNKRFPSEIIIGSIESIPFYSQIHPSSFVNLYQYSTSRLLMNIEDVNDDHYPDILLCDPSISQCLLYYGNKLLKNLPLACIISLNSSNSPTSFFGWAATSLPDINGDKINDFLISSPLENAVYLFYGQKHFTKQISFDSLSKFIGIKIQNSDKTLMNFGIAVSSLGDFNNDGFPDFIVTSMHTTNFQNILFLIYGNSSIFNQDIDLNNPKMKLKFIRIIAPSYSFAGFSVSGIGDINGDNFDDIAIGSIPYSQGGYNQQRTYILFGQQNFIQKDVVLLQNIQRNNNNNGFIIQGGGFMVTKVGDVNQDGLSDIFLVRYFNWQGKSNAYFLTLPKNISSPPTFSPSSNPSSLPSAQPTQLPSTTKPSSQPSFSLPALETNFPTNLQQFTFPPNIPVTRLPSRFPSKLPSLKPTRIPTFIPSKIPFISPTYLPSLIPSLSSRINTNSPILLSKSSSSPSSNRRPSSSSFSTTRKPTRSNYPTSFPTSSPTESLSTTFRYYKITSGEYNLPDGKLNVILEGSGLFTISAINSKGKKVFTIIPTKQQTTIIKIIGFNINHHILDLTRFHSTIHSIKDLSYSTNPLIFYLSNSQTLILSSQIKQEIELTESNFMFGLYISPSKQDIDHTLVVTSGFTLDLSLMISFSLLFTCLISLMGCIYIPIYYQREHLKELELKEESFWLHSDDNTEDVVDVEGGVVYSEEEATVIGVAPLEKVIVLSSVIDSEKIQSSLFSSIDSNEIQSSSESRNSTSSSSSSSATETSTSSRMISSSGQQSLLLTRNSTIQSFQSMEFDDDDTDNSENEEEEEEEEHDNDDSGEEDSDDDGSDNSEFETPRISFLTIQNDEDFHNNHDDHDDYDDNLPQNNVSRVNSDDDDASSTSQQSLSVLSSSSTSSNSTDQ